MNKLIINTSLLALVFASFSPDVDASFTKGDDGDNPFSYEQSSRALVKHSGRSKTRARTNRSVRATVDDTSIVPFGSSSGFIFSLESDMPNPFSSSYAASSSVPVTDDVEEVLVSPVKQPSVVEKLNEEALIGLTHLQNLIDNDQDLSVILSMKTSRALFDNSEIFETFFSFKISEAIKRNGVFSLHTAHLLSILSEDQKAEILAPYGYTKLFRVPIAPRTERFKAVAFDGFNRVVDTVRPKAKKRAHDEMTKHADDLASDQKLTLKRKKSPSDFKTRTEQLDYISKALKSHVEETFRHMNPYFVSNRIALDDLLSAMDMMTVHAVNMIGYHVSEDRAFQWGERDVVRLAPALQNNRIIHLDLGGNLITSKLLPAMNWSGLATLDLNSNYIDSFGSLLQSNIGTLCLNQNSLEKISDESKPTSPNYALERLNLGHNHFENTEMGEFLRILGLFPNLKVLNLSTTSDHFLSSSCLLENLDVTHPKLEVLGLSGWSLDENAIAHVLQLPSIQVLDLTNASFSKGTLGALHKTPSSLKKVVVSYMVGNNREYLNDIKATEEKGIEIIVVQ